MKSKITIIVLIIMLFISGYFNFRNYRNKNQEVRTFLNSFNSYISIVNDLLETLQNSHITDNYQQLEGNYNQLIKELYLLDQFLQDGAYFLGNEFDYLRDEQGFKHIAYTLEGGLKDDDYQGSFVEDGIISENEIKFINQLSKDLEELVSILDEHDQKNSSIIMRRFKNSLKEFYEKWDVIGERTPSGISPYDNLLIR